MNTAVDLDPKDYVPTLELLKKIDFLQGVPDEELKGLLFTLKVQPFPPQKTIIFQGEIANSLFIIRKGNVHISTKSRGTKLILAELQPSQYFGEISLLRPVSATATVIAGEEGAELLIMTHENMDYVAKKVPDIKQRIQTIIDKRLEAKKKAKEAEENAA